MTLKDDHDFTLCESSCASSEIFQGLYGARGDGNVYFPENIEDFCSKLKNSTEGLGVHFLLADGVSFIFVLEIVLHFIYFEWWFNYFLGFFCER